MLTLGTLLFLKELAERKRDSLENNYDYEEMSGLRQYEYRSCQSAVDEIKKELEEHYNVREDVVLNITIEGKKLEDKEYIIKVINDALQRHGIKKTLK